MSEGNIYFITLLSFFLLMTAFLLVDGCDKRRSPQVYIDNGYIQCSEIFSGADWMTVAACMESKRIRHNSSNEMHNCVYTGT